MLENRRNRIPLKLIPSNNPVIAVVIMIVICKNTSNICPIIGRIDVFCNHGRGGA